MEYAVGKTGRTIVARLFEGEDVYEAIEEIARREDIHCGAVLITGGCRSADVVVGPKQEQPKIEPDFHTFAGPGEVFGVGTLYCDDAGPKLHIHTAMGRGGRNLVGCPRGGARTFLILEITIIEVIGVDAARRRDPVTGWNLLRVGSADQ
jgi:predicted DNA-binding protein with PD1-like motif